jgi:hypothetical protein
MKECPVCTLFIDWLRERSAEDVKAVQLLARLDDAREFCEQHAHIDRRLFRDFLTAMDERTRATPAGAGERASGPPFQTPCAPTFRRDANY